MNTSADIRVREVTGSFVPHCRPWLSVERLSVLPKNALRRIKGLQDELSRKFNWDRSLKLP